MPSYVHELQFSSCLVMLSFWGKISKNAFNTHTHTHRHRHTHTHTHTHRDTHTHLHPKFHPVHCVGVISMLHPTENHSKSWNFGGHRFYEFLKNGFFFSNTGLIKSELNFNTQVRHSKTRKQTLMVSGQDEFTCFNNFADMCTKFDVWLATTHQQLLILYTW